MNDANGEVSDQLNIGKPYLFALLFGVQPCPLLVYVLCIARMIKDQLTYVFGATLRAVLLLQDSNWYENDKPFRNCY